jgi:hypothetical protein
LEISALDKKSKTKCKFIHQFPHFSYWSKNMKRKETKFEQPNIPSTIHVELDNFKIEKNDTIYSVEYIISCSCFAQQWTVKKKYLEFCQLHSNLILKDGNSFSDKINFPTLIFHGHLE